MKFVSGKERIVDQLIQLGADINSQSDGYTPLYYAVIVQGNFLYNAKLNVFIILVRYKINANCSVVLLFCFYIQGMKKLLKFW